MANAGTEPVPSVKDLASSEPSVRRSCFKTLITHLNERDPSSHLTSTQCLQIWRGLYVALYMHDSKSAISVQNLTAELAGMLNTMASKDADVQSSSDQPYSWLDTWTTAFWETICREWSSIDQWRMNKVLLLVRFFLRDLFNLTLMSACNDASATMPESKDMISGQIHILESWPLSPRARKVPDGLRLHVLDVWVDELTSQINAVQKELSHSDDSNTETIENVCLNVAKSFMVPLEKVSREALSKGVKIRAREALKVFQEQFPS
ncbi:hypothetical protein EDD37DRAFT_102583 [Exophiala viscosa]|uniref:Uncharacterized protein n=1 Tax=Exophiala viscosa TaxID=2486360 RepID=A0AAN6E1G2_9EURO|nr:hypothetical protein EDD36DRAFT_121935 [Exophiala viscosa]KAI1630378.1 hypothetical protein EDD37DRAFT_102583 [Exophiala viscosa]